MISPYGNVVLDLKCDYSKGIGRVLSKFIYDSAGKRYESLVYNAGNFYMIVRDKCNDVRGDRAGADGELVYP